MVRVMNHLTRPVLLKRYIESIQHQLRLEVSGITQPTIRLLKASSTIER